MAGICGDVLIGGQCCFEGTLSRIELRGEGVAFFSEAEALAGTFIERVRFSPPIHIDSKDGPTLSLVERPQMLEPLSMGGKESKYSVVYALPKENSLGVELSLQNPAPSSLSLQAKVDGADCETRICKLYWPDVPKLYIEADIRPESALKLAGPFPEEGGGRVLEALLTIKAGQLRCGAQTGEARSLKAGDRLRWKVDGGQTMASFIRVSPLELKEGAIGAQVLGDGAPILEEQGFWESHGPKFWYGALGLGILLVAALMLVLSRRKGRDKPLSPKQAASKPIKIFYSYAEEDEKFHQQLEKNLSGLKRAGRIESWDARKIKAGDRVEEQIDQNLEQADIILLLISSDYMASDTLWSQQMQRAMQLRKERGTQVIPIYLRPCHVSDAPFEALESLPRNKQAISERENQDKAFAEIAQELDEMLSRSQASSTDPAQS